MAKAPPSPDTQAATLARYALLLMLLAAGVVFFKIMRLFVVPIIMAAVFAGLFYPLHKRIHKAARGRNGVSAFISCVILSMGLLLPLYGLGALVGNEAMRLYQRSQTELNIPARVEVSERLKSLPLLQTIDLEKIPLAVLYEQGAKTGAELLVRMVNAASRETLELISTLCITFLTMFYFFRDGKPLLLRLRDLSPLPQRHQEQLARRFLSVSRATLKGTLLIAIFKGALGGVTFWAFSIEAPVLWGVAMAFLSVLPVVGAWIIMYPAGLILLLTGQIWQGITVLLIATLVVSSIDNILQPLLVSRDSGMHELLVFFSMLGGIALFGLMGFIIGPLVAALFVTLLDIYGNEFKQPLDSLHTASIQLNQR